MNATINTMPETDNGSHQVPGMCYVPWQTFGKTYDPMRGLAAGTIFPELDLSLIHISEPTRPY